MNGLSPSAHASRPMRRGWRILMWVVIALVVFLAVAYLAIGAIAADRLTRPERILPMEPLPAAFNLAYEDVRLPSRGGDTEIAAWFIPSPDNARAVVMVHGRNKSRTAEFVGHFVDMAATLQRAGFSVLMIDLRGHGESGPGRFTFGLKERQDVLGAVDWLRARGFPSGRIGVLGVSMGAAASVGAVAEEPTVGALVTDSGYADIRPLIEGRWQDDSGLPQVFLHSATLMIRVLYGFDILSCKPVDEIVTIPPRPLMLIHAQTDQTVSVAHLEQLRAAVPSAQVWVTPSGNHAKIYNIDPAEYEAKVAGFFDTSLK